MTIDINALIQADDAKYGSISSIPSPSESANSSDVNKLISADDSKNGQLDDETKQSLSLKRDHRENTDTMGQLKATKGEQAKLDWGSQLGLGVVAFGTAAIDRMMKMGGAVNKLETSAVNSILNTVGSDFKLKSPDLNDVVDSTTGKIKEGINNVTDKGNKLSSLFGINTVNTGDFAGDLAPSVALPLGMGGKALSTAGKLGEAILSGGTAGAVYGASDAASGSVNDIAKGGALGGTVGAILGGTGQGLISITKGIANYTGNRFFTGGKSVEDAQSLLMSQIGSKSDSLLKDVDTSANNIIKSANKDTDLIKGMYDDAYAQQIDTPQLKEIKQNPSLDNRLNKYREKLLGSNDPKDSLAIRYQELNKDVLDNGANNTLYNPQSLESFDVIQRKMNDDIQSLLTKKQNETAAPLIGQHKQLLQILDNMSPDYQSARALAQQNLILKDIFKDVGISTLSGSDTQAYKKLSRVLLDPNVPPQNLEIIRDNFVKQDPNVWRSMVREVFDNKVKDGDPLSFMRGVMADDPKRAMVYKMLDFSGNEVQLVKLEALGKLYEGISKESFVDNIVSANGSMIPIIRNLRGSKANEFNKQARDFIFNSTYNPEVKNILSRPGLDKDQVITQVLQTLTQSPRSPIEKGLSNIVPAKVGALIGSHITPTKEQRK